MNPLTWLSATSRAQMTEMSHHGAFPIHFFWPLMIQVSPSRFAVVVRPPRCSGTHQRFREAEAADLFKASHWWQPLLFLLFRTAEVDGTHCQAAMHSEECRDRRVDACHLHCNQTGEQPATASAAVAFQTNAADVEFLESPAIVQTEMHLRPNIS